ncbi:hypothetical protein Pmar_PMAR009880, partial [Perkinsus marinus ATCC 50983]
CSMVVYDQLPKSDKSDINCLIKKLTAAFSPTPADAFIAFQSRRFVQGESIDNYVSDLKRYLTLSDTDPSACPNIIAEQFVRGLPTEVAAQVIYDVIVR